MNSTIAGPFGIKPDFSVGDDLRDWIIGIRRHIHRYPELSFGEHGTAAFIQQKLSEHGIDSIGGVGGTGVIATIGADTGDRPCVALRADMDALPVAEESSLPFSSSNPGVMHACGHDGHVAMLLGAAAVLKQARPLPGRIKIIFQPAEEHGNGAAALVRAGVVDDVGAIFAGHIDTHYRTGQIIVDEGLICAAADPFRITIRGRGGHAARPHEAADAVVAAANLVMTLQTLISREVDPNKAEVITIGSLHAGSVHNVIAGEALLKGTIRSTDEATRLRTLNGLKRVVRSIASMHEVGAEIVFEDGLPAVVNSVKATGVARSAARDVTSVGEVISQLNPSLGSEDFSFYQQRTEGCMVRFGAALSSSTGPAHSNSFDFDEECLTLGSRWLATVAWRWLEQVSRSSNAPDGQ